LLVFLAFPCAISFQAFSASRKNPSSTCNVCAAALCGKPGGYVVICAQA
jgi:hypothetical protein